MTIIASDHIGPSESEWTLICTRLKTLPRLEELEIGGAELTGRALQVVGFLPCYTSSRVPGPRQSPYPDVRWRVSSGNLPRLAQKSPDSWCPGGRRCLQTKWSKWWAGYSSLHR